MKKVITTTMSVSLQIPICELGNKVVGPGEKFECTDERFDWLSGNNRYHAVFVFEDVTDEKKKK